LFVRGSTASTETITTETQVYEAYASVGASQRKLLRTLLDHARSRPWVDEDCRDMAHWVALNLGMTEYRAARWLSAAEALERLPRVSLALENGTLAIDKVVELARFATAEDELTLISWARRKSVSAIKERGDELERVSLDEVVDVQANRSLSWWWMDDSRLGLMAALPPEEGAALIKAIERLTTSIPDSPTDADSIDPIEARRADALVAMAKATIADDHDPDRATLLVHVDIDALVSSDGPNALIAGGPVLHPAGAGRLGCDGRFQTILHDPNGAVVGIGRASRVVPHHLRRLVEHRDRYRCTFPGCGAKRFTEAHHIVPWERGGPTDLDNLVLICSFHHKLVHDHRWRVSLSSDGSAEWRKPDGTPYVPGRAPPD
jgi:hypothetical protein